MALDQVKNLQNKGDITMRKALCLKTKLFLFESDENLQNKEKWILFK
jgi:hypothetical protein